MYKVRPIYASFGHESSETLGAYGNVCVVFGITVGDVMLAILRNLVEIVENILDRSHFVWYN